ncbi:MAG: hypothetical protein HKN26_00185 [Acidimicrobiales bacterium]|nr:hypothetical protein [Acidimicrobiales bacterium]
MTEVATTALRVALPDGFEIPIAFSGRQGVAEVVAAAIADGDLPRRDFQGQSLAWRLHTADGAAIAEELTLRSAGLTPGTVVTLTAPGATEVMQHRDERLRQISEAVEEGQPSGSVNVQTLAALVRRTESKEHELAQLLAEAPIPSIPTVATVESTESRLPAFLGLGALALLVLAGWLWAFTDVFGAGGEAAVETRRTWPLEVEGELVEPGQLGSHEFRARAGDRVRIEMRVPGQVFDAQLLLYGTDRRLLAENDDNPFEGCCDSLIDIVLPEDGDYEIVPKALDDSQTGPYIVSVTDAEGLPEPPGQGFDGPAFGEEIAVPALPIDAMEEPFLDPGDIQAEEIFTTDAEVISVADRYSLDTEVERGERIIIEFEAVDGDRIEIRLRSNGADPWLGVWTREGLIDENDDTDGLNSEIIFVAPADGTYRIEARDLSLQAGDLELTVST